MDLKLRELASLLNVPEEAIYRWLDSGTIPSYSMNNELRFNREEVEDWLLHHQPLVSQERTEISDLSLKYSLYRAVHRGGLIQGVHVADKSAALRYASSYIAEKFHLDAEVLFEMLSYRETLMSTGIGEGIALPHAKDFLVRGFYDIVVPMLLPQGIEFNALDGKPVNVLFFLFACQDKSHLNLVNKIVNLGTSPEMRRVLQSQPDKNTLLKCIKKWESEHGPH